MENRRYEPDEWDVAVGYAYQANQAWDEWQEVLRVNRWLDQNGLLDVQKDPSTAEEKYSRLNNLVGLMIGPTTDEYRDFMGISDNSNKRSDVIVYMIDGVERFIERK